MRARIIGTAALAAGLFGLAACGGGGGSGGGGSSSGTGGSGGNTLGTIDVTLSPNNGGAVVTDDATQTSLTTTATVGESVSTPVVADLQYDKTIFSSVTAVAGTGGTYAVTMQTLSGLAVGEYKGTITFRLCEETACTDVYPGSTAVYSYDIVVNLQDWMTYQRTGGHAGYVPVTLDASKFTQAWQWTLPAGKTITAINSVATGGGHVYITNDDQGADAWVYALNEADGSLAWKTDVAALRNAGPPAYGSGWIYLNTTSNNGVTYQLNAATGVTANQYSSGGSVNLPTFAPVVTATNLYLTSVGWDPKQIIALFNVGFVQSYGLNGNTTNSSQPATTGWGTATAVATDGKDLYYYGVQNDELPTGNLDHFDAASLTKKASIKDTFSPTLVTTPGLDPGYDYFGAPVIAGSGDVVAYSGPGNTDGFMYGSTEPPRSRQIVDYKRATDTLGWATAQSYLTTPAVANGVLYAARNGPASFDAIDMATGKVSWSWTPPSSDTGFHRNTVVTNNLAFVSTDKAVYAVDLTTHQQVWSYPKGGSLALSAAGVLYIATGTSQSDGGLIAIKVK